jgi:hypothetical protein
MKTVVEHTVWPTDFQADPKIGIVMGAKAGSETTEDGRPGQRRSTAWLDFCNITL